MIYSIKKLKKIGNSKGLVIPKFYLEQLKSDTYKIKLGRDNLIITPVHAENEEENKD